MDPVARVRDFLLDNVGHMTFPGNPSFHPGSQHWFVPVYCRTAVGNIVVGDVDLDSYGHIIFAPSAETMISRLAPMASVASQPSK